MANRYWVGGTANWDGTAGTKWATTSGGAGGASVPTASDDVYFDANSGAVTVTVNSTASCLSMTCTGFTGTIAGSAGIQVVGNVTLVSGMGFTHSGGFSWNIANTSGVLVSAGKTVNSVVVGGTSFAPTVTLGDALLASGVVLVVRGTFTTNNYNVTATSISSNNSNTRTINLGSSTVTLTSATIINFSNSTNLTFNAGTSSIIASAASNTIDSGNQTFYDVTFTNTSSSTRQLVGNATFNNLTFAGRTAAGISNVNVAGNQTINGTLTLSAGTNATMRTFVRSDTIGTTRTLTCASVASLTDIDFRDITIAGAAAPVSGTRLGDCKGNSGITFPAAKTVYWRASGSSIFSGNVWSASSGGSISLVNFPLAQDTAIFDDANVQTGTTATINAAYNFGTIDMSGLVNDTMTLATGSTTPAIYGDWINGTGTTLTGTGVMTFAGRGSQTITSAGKTFGQSFLINTPSGSVTLQDAFTGSNTGINTINLFAGTFDANGYNVTLPTFGGIVTASRTAAIGSGTWTLNGSGTQVWNFGTSTNLTVTGTGTISLTSASAKTFAGGGIQTYPTINQGGTGTLTVTGSNKFADITNTAIGRVQFTGGTTNEFTAFNLNGVSGNLLQLGSTNTTQAILKAPSWNVGANSTDGGNNTGLSFTAGTVDYLSISYINGQIVAPPVTATGNFLMFFN